MTSRFSWAQLLRQARRSPRALPEQLALPLGDSEGAFHSLSLGPDDDADGAADNATGAELGRLAVLLTPWGARIALDLRHHASAHDELLDLLDGDHRREQHWSWRAELRVTFPATASLPPAWPGPFWLLPRLGSAGRLPTRAFSRLLQAIAGTQAQHLGKPIDAVLLEVARLLLRTAAHLAERASAPALAATRGYTEEQGLHFFVYQQVLADESGRIAQLADVCPGLLGIAKALADRQAPAAEALVAAIRAGRKLPRLLDLAADAWREEARRAGVVPELLPELARVTRQRLRRAGKRVAPRSLLSLFAPGLVAQDIPASADANASWYQRTSHPLLWPRIHGQSLPTPQLRALGALLSRRGPALLPRLAAGSLASDLRDLRDYLLASQRVPRRNSNPDALLAAAKSWREPPDEEPTPQLPPETPLDGPTIAPWQEADASVVRLQTVGELEREGRRMGHCVGSYAVSAASGAVQVFHASLGHLELTVMTAQRHGRIEIVEVAGPANRAPSDDERQMLQRWLGAIAAPPPP